MLIPGLSNTDAEGVYVGNVAATEVYLGTTLVWPTPPVATTLEATNTQEEL
jgi:hypothetical protein